MKVLKFAVVLLAVGMFAVPAIAQDTCATAVAYGTPLDPCADGTAEGPLGGGCTSGGGVLDVWMTFTATAAAHRIRTDLNSTGTDSDYLVLSGACGSQVQMGCSEDEFGYLGDICVGGFVPGNTYYVRLGTWGDYCPNGPYVVDVEAAPGGACGDGTISCVAGAEQCDDGNTISGDGCSSTCRFEYRCGNNVVEPPNGEMCDGTGMPQCASGFYCSHCQCVAGIPAVSEWGLVVLTLIGLVSGTILFGRRRVAVS